MNRIDPFVDTFADPFVDPLIEKLYDVSEAMGRSWTRLSNAAANVFAVATSHGTALPLNGPI